MALCLSISLHISDKISSPRKVYYFFYAESVNKINLGAERMKMIGERERVRRGGEGEKETQKMGGLSQ